MNKLFFLGFLIVVSTYSIRAQNNPVHWENKVVASDTGIVLIFNAKIDKGWHLYSQHLSDTGPLPTVFTFASSNSYLLKGKVDEPTPHQEMDEAFGVMVSYFDTGASFKQAIELKALTTVITGTIDYMVCDNSMCIPFTETFSFAVKP